MPQTVFSQSTTAASVNLEASNTPRNADFSDARGLSFVNGFSAGSPYGWTVANGGVTDGGAAGWALTLGPNGTADGDFGVLTDSSFVRLEMKLPGLVTNDNSFGVDVNDPGYPYAEAPVVRVFADLVIDGVVIATQQFALVTEGQDDWSTVLDLSNADLSAYDIGETPITLRLRNESGVEDQGYDVSIDDVSSPDAQSNTFYSTGVLTLSNPLDPAGNVEINNIALSGDYTVANAGDLAQYMSVEVSGDQVYWEFEAPKSVFATLADDDLLDVSFDVVVTDPDSQFDTASVTVTLTGQNEAIVAADLLAQTVLEDGSFSAQLVATDPDEADTQTFTINGGASKGTITLDEATGAFTYTPFAHANGTDSFEFAVVDAAGARSVGRVEISITAQNDAPFLINAGIVDGDFELLKDTSFDIYLASYIFDDVDASGADMTLTFSGHDGKGSLDIDGDFLSANGLTYDANAGTVTGALDDIRSLMTTIGKISYLDTSGQDVVITFSVSDNGSGEGAAIDLPLGQISFAIKTNPVAEDAQVDGVEEVVIQGQLQATDGDGDTLSFAVTATGQPSSGTVVVATDGTYTYTPNPNFYGSDSFSYVVTDGETKDYGTVNIALINTNDAPIVQDELVRVQAGSDVSGRLDGLRVGSDPLSYTISEGGAPSNGTLALQPDGRYTYTPNDGFSGYDSFTFAGVAGGLANVAMGRVFVFANVDTPVVGALSVDTIAANGTRTGTIQALDPNGDQIAFSIAEGDGPENGTLTLNEDGSFTFVPDAGFTDVDSFFVTVTDGENSARSEVTISAAGTLVNGVLTGTLAADQLLGTSGDDVIAALGISEESGQAGDTVSAMGGDDDILLAGDDAAGVFIDGGTGEDRVIITTGTGEADLTGTTFQGVEQLVGNGEGIRFDGELDLSGVPVVTNTGQITGGDGDDTLHGGNLADDFDGGAGVNNFVVTGSVLDHVIAVQGNGQATITNSIGQVDTVQNVEAIIFDDFTYYIDGRDNAPFIGQDGIEISADEVALVNAADLSGNDVDVDGDSVEVTGVTGNADLNVTLDAGQISVEASENFDALAEGETAVTSFEYEVTAGAGSSTGQVEVTVVGVNDAPDAAADEAETNQYAKVTGNVLSNDVDVDNGAVLSISGVSGGNELRDGFSGTSEAGAKVNISTDGTFTYDPRGFFASLELDETTSDSFTYTVTDEHGAETTETVTIEITGVAPPQLGPNTFIDYARGGTVVSEIGGLLADNLAENGTQITAVAGSQALELHEIVDDAIVVTNAFKVTGSDGGTFVVDRDGAIRFDPGNAFDELKGDQTRETTFEFTITEAGGQVTSGTAKVIVRASDLAPSIETVLTQGTAPALSATGVTGSFDQLGGVDVLGELFDRFDSNIPIDLDSLLDFDVIDIDTVFKASYSAESGINFEVTDNSVNDDALISGLGDKLNPAAEFVTDAFNTVANLPLQPIYFGPTFDLEFGVKAKLGWDIELPSLGKTAVFQPVALDLLLPDAPVTAGQGFLINTGNFVSETPTVAVQTVGLGDIKVDAGFAITSAKVSNVGVEFGTKDFLGLEIDDVVDGGITLKRDFDLLGIAGSDDSDPASFALSLSIRDIVDAVLTQDFNEFYELVQAVIADANKSTLRALGDFIVAGLEAIAENAAVMIDLGNDVQIKPSDLIKLTDKIPFNEFDGFDDDGVGHFLLEDANGAEVEVTGNALVLALENSDVSNALEEVKTILGEDGFEPIPGLKLFAELPIGNIEEIEGFGNDVVGPQAGTQQIEVVQTTRLAGLSVDFEELAPEVAKIVIDKVTEVALEGAKAQPYLIPVVIGASIAARTELELQQQYLATIEEGFASELKLQPLELVAAAINPFIDGVNAITDFLNGILSEIPLLNGIVLPTIPNLTLEGLETAFDATIDAMADGLSAAFSGLANIASDVLEFIADNPAFTTTADLLGTVAGFSAGSAGGALSTLSGAAGKLSDLVGLDLGPITGILDSAASLAYAGSQAGYDLTNSLQSLLNNASSLAQQGAAEMTSTIDTFAGFVKDLAKGVDLQLSTEFDLFTFNLDAGIDLIQIAKFDPDEVEVTYTVDGFDSTQVVGDAAEFFASGDPGDILDGKATYSFSGDVDYDYRVKLDIQPFLQLLGIKVEGEATLGNDTHYDINFDYAGVKTTHDFGLDDLADLDPTALFDDALLELPLGFFEEIAESIADNIRDGLGEVAGQSTDLDFNEFRLFELHDVEISQDQFTKITQDFEIEIGAQSPDPHIDLNFDENTSFQVAVGNLRDGMTGSMARVEGSALNFGELLSLMGGQLFVTTDGDVVYRDGDQNDHLNLGDTKTDIIEYHMLNDDGSLSLLAARVVVNGINDVPIAFDDSVAMLEDSTLLFDPRLNDVDVDDGAVLSLVSVSSDVGTAAIVGDRLSFTPDDDFFGTVTIDYVVQDEHGATSVATVTVTVQPVADDVRTQDDTATLAATTTLTFDVTANDVEVDGEAIMVKSVAQPSKGSVQVVSATQILFDPLGAFDGLRVGDTESVTVQVTVSDETGADQIQTVTFTVEGANDAPSSTVDAYTIDEDAVGVFTVLENDSDVDVGDVLGLISATNGANGTTTIDQLGRVTYTPDEDFNGVDRFTYTVTDEHGAASSAEVEVDVRSRGEILRDGTAQDDDFEIADETDGRTVIFNGGDGADIVTSNVFKGKIDLTDAEFVGIETLDLNFGIIRVAGGGRLDLSAVQAVVNSRGVYADGGGQTIIGTDGRDVISGGLGADMLFGLEGDDVFVFGANEAAGDIVDGGEGYDRVRANFMSTALDIEGATFISIEELDASGTAVQVGASGTLDLSGVTTIVNTTGLRGTAGADEITGSQGADVIRGDGGSDILDGQDGDDIFEIVNTAANQSQFIGGVGTDTLRLDVGSETVNIDGATLNSIEVLDGQDGAFGFSGTFDLGAFEEVRDARFIGSNGVDVLISDHDQTIFDGMGGTDTLVLTGSVFDYEITDNGPSAATLTGPGGKVYEVTNVEKIAFDNFEWQLDGSGNGPVTAADIGAVIQDGTVQITTETLMQNDRDVQDEDFDVTSVASSGALGVSLENGAVTVDASDDSFDDLAVGETREEEFTYTVTNLRGGTTTEVVTVTVTGLNDAPVAQDDIALTSEDALAQGNVLQNDSDVDNGSVLQVTQLVGGTLTDGVFSLVLPSGATVTLTPSGDFSYDPTGQFDALQNAEAAQDSFSYVVTDDQGVSETATVTIEISGLNDAPTVHEVQNTVAARDQLSVGTVGSLLVGANDADDAAGTLALTGITDGMQVAGSDGGVFTLYANGTYSFDSQNDFDGVAFGESRDTYAEFDVIDPQGAVSTSRLVISVEGPNTAPAIEGDGRFGTIVTAEDWAALDTQQVEGSFDQLGSIDVVNELFERLDDATGFDINDLLDFTLIDISKRFDINVDGDTGATLSVTDLDTPEGVLAEPLGTIIDDSIDLAQDLVDTFLPLDLGPVQVTPTFDAQIGLDLELGWEIDVPTLGRTSIFQPVEFDFGVPDEVEAGSLFLINSDNLVSGTPLAVVETMGIGRFALKAGFALPETSVKNIGFDIRSSDFGPFELDGLAQTSVSLNREFTLDEALEKSKELVQYALETIIAAGGQSLPFDPSEVLSTILNLDVANLIEGLFNSDFDFTPLLDAVSAGDPETILNEVLSMISELSESGGDAQKTANINGAMVSDRDVYDMALNAKFNDYDGFEEDGTGYFALELDSGETVHATQADVDVVASVRGVLDKVNTLKTIVESVGIAPIDGVEVQLGVPVGNVEEITEFGGDTGQTLTENDNGTQSIELVQTTQLVSINLDFDALQSGMMQSFLDLAMDGLQENPNAGAQAAVFALQAQMALGTELQATLEEGAEFDLTLSPAALVTASVNGLLDAVNLFGQGVDALVPGPDVFSEIDRIENTDTLETFETALETGTSTVSSAFQALEPLIDIPVSVLQTVLGVVNDAYAVIGNAAVGGVTFLGGQVLSGINSAISALESARDFGFTISLPFIDDIRVEPFKALLAGPVAILETMRDVISAGVDAVSGLNDLIQDLNDAVAGLLDTDLSDLFDSVMDTFNENLVRLAEGADLAFSLGVTPFDVQLQADLSVIQIAKFDPNAVEVTYEFDGYTVDTEVGNAVAFFAPDAEAGSVIDGTAQYTLSGEVDYEYRLSVDINPTITLFGVELEGEIGLGKGDNRNAAEFDLDYALVTSGSVDPNNLLSFFDEAALELPFEFLLDQAGDIAGNIYDSIGLDLPFGGGVEDGDLVLFKVDDVALTEDQFTKLQESFQITIAELDVI